MAASEVQHDGRSGQYVLNIGRNRRWPSADMLLQRLEIVIPSDQSDILEILEATVPMGIQGVSEVHKSLSSNLAVTSVVRTLSMDRYQRNLLGWFDAPRMRSEWELAAMNDGSRGTVEGSSGHYPQPIGLRQG